MNALAVAMEVLFNDPNGAVDGTFTSRPGAQPVPVRVFRTSVTDRVAGGIANFGSEATADGAEIQTSRVPDRPLTGSSGASITYDGRTRRIASAEPARNGLTWVLGLQT